MKGIFPLIALIDLYNIKGLPVRLTNDSIRVPGEVAAVADFKKAASEDYYNIKIIYA